VPRRLLIAICILGGLIRLAALPLPGHDDVIVWKLWSHAATVDLTGMYGVGGSPPIRGVVRWGEHTGTVEYPPVFLYEYAAVGYLYRALFPSFPDGPALLLAIKMPILVANAGLAWLLAVAARRAAGRDDVGWWAGLGYWLNPATLFGGELLGYVDPLFMLPAVGGLVATWRGRRWWGATLVALAVSTKPQALLLGPALALLLWPGGGALRIWTFGSVFLAVFGLTLVPFALRGAWSNMWLAFGVFYERRDTMSAYAANLGWLTNWWLRSSMGVPELGWRAYLQVVPRPLAVSRFQELGYPDPKPICLAAVSLVTAWAGWISTRSPGLAAAAALGAFTVHTVFVVNVGAHENHQLLEIPLLVLAGALRPRLRPLAALVSAIVTLNINYVYGIGIGWGWAVPRQLVGVDISVVLAVLNTAALVWFAIELRRPSAVDFERRSAV
jgi:hypothetical protein